MQFLQNNTTFFRLWTVTAAVTIFLPLIIFGVARLSNAQQGNDENNNNNNGGNQDRYCHWYQWNCSNNDNNENDGEQRDENEAPWWWYGAGERRREDGPSPALVFCYCWSLLMFMALVKMGYDGVINGQERVVSASLFMFANMCLLLLILVSGIEGVVETDGPELEENGFYGQMGVLMYLSFLLWLVWSATFIFLVRKRTRSKITTIEIGDADYQIHSDPVVDHKLESV